MKTCLDCNGDGVIEKGTDDEQQCPTCGGSGFVPDDNDDNEEVIRTGSRVQSSPFEERLVTHRIKKGPLPASRLANV
jgi:RecJ-like exonuclease